MTDFALPPALLENARRFYAGGRTPVPPRVAATVVLLRPTATGGSGGAEDGFEVYVIRRAASMAFGGVYAFPGGGVDLTDSQVHLDWSGPPPQQWARRLGVPADQAQAVVCAAAREVFEEAGVLLAGPQPDTVVGDVSADDWESARRALVAREIGFADLLRERKLFLRADLLAPWARWITPEFEPRRFDTYFFVAMLPDRQRTRDVSGEADHTMWVRPTEVLARAAAGEIAMLPPTAVTVREVAANADPRTVLAAAAHRDAATPVMPRLEVYPDGSVRFVLA